MKRFILSIVAVGFIILGSVLFYYISGPAPVYCEKSFSENNRKVLMFSTRWCPYCKKARQLFNENGIEYCEYDVNDSPAARDAFAELGGSGVPLIIIGGETFYGYSKEAITTALQQLGLIH